MTNYGKIKSYDSGNGRGSITPEKGGEALDFVKADLQQQAQEPKTGQRYGYDTRQVDGGKPPGHQSPARAGAGPARAGQAAAGLT